VSAALATLVPILALIALGVWLGRSGFLDAAGWRAIDRMLFQVLFPALVIEAVARLGAASREPFLIAAALGLGQVTVTLIAVALRPLILRFPGGSRPAFAAFAQGVVRWNTAVAVALVAAVHGSDGVVLMAFAIAVMIPFANLVSVTVLTLDGDNDHEMSFASILRQLAHNPFLRAVAVGLVLAVLPVSLPGVVTETLHILAQAATGLALLTVGAGIDLRRVFSFDPIAVLSAVVKLALMPTIVFGFATLFGLGPAATAVALIAASVPTASAGYTLARQMGGDADLMARIIALQTAIALVTVPLIAAAGG
jgi:predicted permease